MTRMRPCFSASTSGSTWYSFPASSEAAYPVLLMQTAKTVRFDFFFMLIEQRQLQFQHRSHKPYLRRLRSAAAITLLQMRKAETIQEPGQTCPVDRNLLCQFRRVAIDLFVRRDNKFPFDPENVLNQGSHIRRIFDWGLDWRRRGGLHALWMVSDHAQIVRLYRVAG